MIAGVRQFKLINGNGTEYDMTRPDALLHAPDGLGWGTEATVNRLGMTYIGINEKEIHQSPSGEMVFRTYEEYGRFLSFCQQGGLVLCYKPIDTWYYCECLISIQKSEIQWENNHLICPVQFTLLSYWYEKVVAQTAEPPEPVEPNYRTVTGDPAVFNARYSYPIKDLSVAIQGSQELNGYDKPWVGGRGKNLFNINRELGTPSPTDYAGSTSPRVFPLDKYVVGYARSNYYNPAYVNSCTVENGTITAKISNSGYGIGFACSVKGNTQYTISWSGDMVCGCAYFDSDWNLLGNNGANVSAPLGISTPANTAYAVVVFLPSVTNTEQTASNIQLEQGTTATEWMPYENICPITAYESVTITQSGSQTNTYEVELTGAGNVYKGTLDVTTGELVVDEIEISLAGITWSYNNYGAGEISTVLNDYSNVIATEFLKVVAYSSISWSDSFTSYNPNSHRFIVHITGKTKDEQISIANQYNAVFALATPLTYTLTPTQLSNLIGQNSIKADAGEVTVIYRTDARTEYKVYPYQYSYKYGETAQNVFDIDCDLPSYFKLTIFGEATNPSWRVVQNGNIVKSGKLNATIGSSQKLVINTDPKNTEIALYTLSNTRINNLYGYSDFATERIFALPQGECQVQVLTEDEQPPKVMIEVLKHV